MICSMPRSLLTLLLAYTTASAFHYVHNAIFLESYPNMPDWISRIEVYGALLLVTAIGVLGYLFYRFQFRRIGLIVIAIYAGFGFDGLAHYSLAPVSEHTVVMNLTIWSEVITASLLLLVVFIIIARHGLRADRTNQFSARG